MAFFETKKINLTIPREKKNLLLATFFLALFSFIFAPVALATDYSSSSFIVKDSVIDEGSETSTSTNFGLGQSIGQLAIGKSTSTNFQLWSGFQYYYLVSANTLTATAGDSEVDLSWTVPQTFLGITVDEYEVGTGTTSGNYTFENVGSVTNFTKTGLTNDTPYFFIVKALSPGGNFLVFSNEATATPTGAANENGGGSGSQTMGITFHGTAYPQAKVFLLRDGAPRASITANSLGEFALNSYGPPPGNHNYVIYATDPNGVKSKSLNFFETIAPQVIIHRTNIIVPPTLVSSHTAIKQGDPLTLSGFAAPNAPVSIHMSGTQAGTFNVVSANSGAYSYILNTANYKKGQYSAVSNELVGLYQSQDSLSITFTIGDSTVVVPPPGVCSVRSDLNCDGRVDLVDFSILLYYWEQFAPFKNERVDIDKSGQVELRDFSIMLYEWTG